MRSTVDRNGEIIDNRSLTVSVRLNKATENECVRVFACLFNTINELFGDYCVLDWNLNNRVLKNEQMLFDTKYNGEFSACLMGDVKGKRVTNKSTLKQYTNHLHFHGRQWDEAQYYSEYYKKNILKCRNDPKKFRKELIKLYSLEGMESRNQVLSHDIHLNGACYRIYQDSWRGEFIFFVKTYCLDTELKETGEELFDMGKRISAVSNNADIELSIDCVAAEPDYRYLFGFLNIPAGFFKDDDKEILYKISELESIAYNKYIIDIGWANIISPGKAQLFKGHIPEGITDNVETTVLDNGAVCIRIASGVEDLKLKDLKKVKELMYPVLLPGHREYALDHRFRNCWEYVPILDKEIIVEDDEVILRMDHDADIDYILSGEDTWVTS